MKMIKVNLPTLISRLSAFLILALALSACVPQGVQQPGGQTAQLAPPFAARLTSTLPQTGPTTAAVTTPTWRQANPDFASFRASSPRALIRQMNATRRAQGLSTLRTNERLNRAARLYAQELAGRQTLDHTDLRGQGPEKRVEATGYTWTYVAENLAAGQNAPSAVINDWLDSPGHRAALLNNKADHVGVGLVKTTDDPTKDPYGSYWVAVFAKPSNDL